MRVVAYAVAVLAAAGIIYFLSGANDKGQTTGSAAAPAPVVAEAEAAAPAALGPDESLVVFKVPGMHCPHGCYPTVKETLAGQPGVKSVSLAKQSDPDLIDNPSVSVVYTGKLDTSAAIDALDKAGFKDSTVVQ